jgi:hypothetical protein
MFVLEVETVLPELVGADKSSHETLDYAKLTAFLSGLVEPRRVELPTS